MLEELAHQLKARLSLAQRGPTRSSASSERHPSHPFWHFEWDWLKSGKVLPCGLVLFISGLLCSAGGIGGGGIYVTVLMIFGGLDVADAIPLSKSIVLLGSMASIVLNMRSPPASQGKELRRIDFSACRLVVPGSLLGTYLGVLLNWILPSWIILTVLTSILVVMTIMVGRTTVLQYWEENRRLDAPAEAMLNSTQPPSISHAPTPEVLQDLADEEAAKVLARHTLTTQDLCLGVGLELIVVTGAVFRHHASRCLHASESSRQKVCNHPALTLFHDNALEALMMGKDSGPVLLGCAMAIPMSLCVVALLYFCRQAVSEGRQAGETVLYGSMAVVTGCLAGLVGIGGGLIFSPFFLLMGLSSPMAVATSSTCVIFTSSSTTLQYLLTDRIILSLTLVYGLVNWLASYLGTSFVHYLQERWAGRHSFISAVVWLGVAISTVLAVIKLADLFAHREKRVVQDFFDY